MTKSNNLLKYKVVLSGGPGSGKSTIINQLILRKYKCFEEVSRSLIKEAQKKNYFKNYPLEFSEKVFNARVEDYEKSEYLVISSSQPYIFFDRGIHDTVAYLNYLGKTNNYKEKLFKYKYDLVFLLDLNEDFYINDNERLETFHQALKIHKQIEEIYLKSNHETIKIPWMQPIDRTNFIINYCLNAFS